MTDELESTVVLGVITGSHGVSGRVRVKPFTHDPQAVAAYGQVRIGEGSHKIKVTGAAKGQVIVALEGVGDRDAADALRGMELTVARAALDAGDVQVGEVGDDETGDDDQSWFQADLIGLGVESAEGKRLGTVTGMFDFGAGDLLEIKPTLGGEAVLMAFTLANVPMVDVEGGRLVIDPPLGTFEVEGDKPAPRKRRRSPKARARALAEKKALAEKEAEAHAAEGSPQGPEAKRSEGKDSAGKDPEAKEDV